MTYYQKPLGKETPPAHANAREIHSHSEGGLWEIKYLLLIIRAQDAKADWGAYEKKIMPITMWIQNYFWLFLEPLIAKMVLILNKMVHFMAPEIAIVVDRPFMILLFSSIAPLLYSFFISQMFHLIIDSVSIVNDDRLLKYWLLTHNKLNMVIINTYALIISVKQ